MQTEYIEREALKEDLKESYDRLRAIYDSFTYDEDKQICAGQLTTFTEAILRVKDAPAADVAPVRHGRWTIAEDDYYGLNIVKCSVCHEEWCFEERDDVFDLNYHYCPNCGAYMMGENNGKCE